MAENTIQWEKDADGIVTLTMDDPTGSANVMNEHYAESMHNAVERLVAEKDSITGVVITSAKKTFFAGGDLKGMINLGPENAGEAFDTVENSQARPARVSRRWASRSSPPSTARRSAAAWRSRWRVITASPPTSRARVVGLPEVTLGLLPGGGGVTRTVRMFGIQKAFMEVLSQGTRFKPAQGQGDRPGRRVASARRGAGARREGVDQGQPRQPHPAVGCQGLQDARRHSGQPGAGGHPAVVPGAAEEAAQGCADARAARHPGRGRRGRAGGLRHRQPHREPLLHAAGHRPGRQEHDPGVLLRPAGHQRWWFAARRHRQDPDQQDRRAGRGHDGRRHRLRVGQGRLRRGAQGRHASRPPRRARATRRSWKPRRCSGARPPRRSPRRCWPASRRRPTPPTSRASTS